MINKGKHKGSVCDYIDERDNFFLKLRRKFASDVDRVRPEEIENMIAKYPPPRLWISEWRVKQILFRYKKIKNVDFIKLKERKRMAEYIVSKYESIISQAQGMCFSEIVHDIIYSNPPESYMSPSSIKSIISRRKSRMKGKIVLIQNGKSTGDEKSFTCYSAIAGRFAGIALRKD